MGQRSKEKLRYLSELEFFRDFSRQEMREMEQKTAMFSYLPGRHFYSAGDMAEVLFILKEGSVHLYRLAPDGRKLIVATLHKGAVFGEMSLVGQRMHNTFAEAATPARICVMSRVDVEAMLVRKPQMALRLMDMMGERLAEAERQLERMAFGSVPSRLAGQLLELGAQGDQVTGYTHQALAEMVGSYRETVTTVLNDFRAQGLVTLGRKAIRILDRSRLAEVARPE